MLPSAWLAAVESEPGKEVRRKAGKARRSRYYRILGQLNSLTEGGRRRIVKVCETLGCVDDAGDVQSDTGLMASN